MKIMSFNTQNCLHYLEKRIDFEIMAKTINDYSPDVVGLQEMRGVGERADYEAQTEKLSALTGMPYCYFAKATYFEGEGPFGNAILSKIPFESVETVPIPDPCPHGYEGYYETRALLRARLTNGVTVLITHFGLNPDEKENAVRTVLENIKDEKCVLMGDFNLLPSAPLLLPIRERMKDTADLFTEEKQSFPSDAPTRKLDYIFVSRDATVEEADILPVVASDHRPHVATVCFL
jgi:endonuclease/exonuclease/phosphatase family metal-dependent hydrolase